ncbi:MAG: nitroreductase family protein [Candidatus Rokubacteria bacterium]|nr:nitroreductase family protein [Candidatus Rokubacteria bacterium]
MTVADAIRTKRAVRDFAPQRLPDDVVRSIVNAGRRAQSSKNTQPWHFIAIQERQMLETLSRLGPFAGHLAGAALGVAVLSPNHAPRWSIMFDAGQAAAYMQLAAWELGVASCLATIYEQDAARNLLGFPDDLHLNVALSFGYPLDPTVLTAPPRAGGRRPFEESVHVERWRARAPRPPDPRGV